MKILKTFHLQGNITMARSGDSHKTALWQQRLADFEAGSQSVAEFCNSVGCSIASFYQWRRKVGGDSSSPQSSSLGLAMNGRGRMDRSSNSQRPFTGSAPSAFLPVTLRSATAVVVTLANGTRLELACDPHSVLQSILQQSRAGQ